MPRPLPPSQAEIDLIAAVVALGQEIRKWRHQSARQFEQQGQAGLVTKHDLKEMGDRIMSKISEASEAVLASLASLNGSVDGLVTDFAALNAKIDELQNSSGTVSPEDQALLDSIQSTAKALAERVKALDESMPAAA